MMLEKIDVKFYEFDELSESIKNTIINTFIQSLLDSNSVYDKVDFIKQAIIRAERNQTPWFTPNFVWEYGKEQILSSLRATHYTINGTSYDELMCIIGDKY